MAQQQAPSLESFGLSPTAYREYEQKRARLELVKRSYEIPDWLIFLICSVTLFFVLIGLNSNIAASVIIAFYLSIIIVSWFSERICNFLSGGKYNASKRNLERLHTTFEERIRPFELTARSYYETRLKEFYETRLFRKRSGSSLFEEALSEFSGTLAEVEEANKLFKTTHIWSHEYEKYLVNRQINHIFSREQVPSDFSTLRRITSAQKEKIAPEKLRPAPEQLYAKTRIVDWDEVNRARRLTGLRAEEIVILLEKDYLVSINRQDLAEKVVHVAKEAGDSAGYDVLSFMSNGREKYIEVKGTTGVIETPFLLSSNELEFLKRNRQQAYIYRVGQIREGAEIRLQVYGAGEILDSSDMTPKLYLVRMH